VQALHLELELGLEHGAGSRIVFCSTIIHSPPRGRRLVIIQKSDPGTAYLVWPRPSAFQSQISSDSSVLPIHFGELSLLLSSRFASYGIYLILPPKGELVIATADEEFCCGLLSKTDSQRILHAGPPKPDSSFLIPHVSEPSS